MSKWPWPERLKRIVGDVPSSRAFTASSIAARTAWFGFRRRHDALGARELHAGLEAGVLMIGARFDQAELLAMADQRRHAVIAQAAGMEARRNEGRAERMHLDERRQMPGVAEIIGVAAAGQGRASGGFDRDDAPLRLSRTSRR